MERSAIFMMRWLYTVSLPSWCELRNKNLTASFLLGHSIMSHRWKFTCYVVHSHFIIPLPSHELIPRKQGKKNQGLRFQFLLHEKDIRSRHIHFIGTLEIIVHSPAVENCWWSGLRMISHSFLRHFSYSPLQIQGVFTRVLVSVVFASLPPEDEGFVL